ncbi:MAG: RNA polymerase sigma factor [Chitinophagales bacterium]
MKQETKLIQQCLAGNRQAQFQLYGQFKAKMFGLCYRYAKNRAEAQDMLQDGFVKVFQKLHTYRAVKPLGAWIHRIMVNTALEHIRKRKMVFDDFATVESPAYNARYQAQDDIMGRMEAKALIQLLRQLPVEHQTILNLYAIEGYSHKEIGEMLHISVSNSKVRLMRARKAFKIILEKNLIHK